jgi:hypothetical protein
MFVISLTMFDAKYLEKSAIILTNIGEGHVMSIFEISARQMLGPI